METNTSSVAHYTKLQAAGSSFDATATSGEFLFSKLKFLCLFNPW